MLEERTAPEHNGGGNEWGANPGEDLEADTWEECLQRLLASGGDQTIYRGHACFDWELKSSIERRLLDLANQSDERKYKALMSMAVDPVTDAWTQRVELWLTEEFRREAARLGATDLPESWDTLGWWELMQHHGAPTRLMDWTSSPFVALWFALDEHQNGTGDMALWIFDRRNGALNHMKSVIALRASLDYQRLGDRERVNRLVERVIGEGHPALLALEPRHFQRSAAQQSVLTITSSIGVGRPAHWWLRRRLATRVRLREEWAPAMWATFRSIGLSRRVLYQDLDSLGEELSRVLDENPDPSMLTL